MVVVDANVVAYLLIEGEKTAQARKLWAKDPGWYAPRLLFYELANVFSLLVKQGIVPLDAGLTGLTSGCNLVSMFDREPPAGRILQIASTLSLSAYDASYLTVAEILRAPLVTEDARLLRVAPEIARSLESFGD